MDFKELRLEAEKRGTVTNFNLNEDTLRIRIEGFDCGVRNHFDFIRIITKVPQLKNSPMSPVDIADGIFDVTFNDLPQQRNE